MEQAWVINKHKLRQLKTEKAMNPNKTEPTQNQRETDLNPQKNPSLQFGLSISIGVLTIIIFAVAIYSGIIH
jgi:hypothetical protein